MSTFSQLPGQLDIQAVPSDEWNIAINLQRDITNYTFTSYIYKSATIGTGGGTGAINSIGTTVVAPTIGIVNAATWSMVIGISEAQSALLSPSESYRWYLRWVAPGDITRTIVSGSVTAVAP